MRSFIRKWLLGKKIKKKIQIIINYYALYLIGQALLCCVESLIQLIN
jgi:hypothetical protein